jgi:peptidoglycan/xylan/chitin deacetylase (PgdA/CDA1 family)
MNRHARAAEPKIHSIQHLRRPPDPGPRMPTMSKKDQLAYFLNRSRSFQLQRALGLQRANEFIVLTYHRIVDGQTNGRYPFDEELISASAAEFDWQMAFIAEHFRPQRLGTLLRMCRENRPIPAGSVAVTFDDGFLDNYAVAYPILRRHAVPATFFITTDFVERDEPIWFEVVAYAFLSLAVNSIVHPLCDQAAPSLDDRATRLAELARVMRKLKLVADDQRKAFVAHLLTLVDAAALERDWRRHGGAMRWEHLAEMARNDVEIGSHTVSHPILSKTEGQVLVSELADSKRTLEQKVGMPVELIAYPVGGRAHFSPEVVDVARRVGYEFGISYVAGVNRPAGLDPFFVRRHTVERYMSRERFEAQLCLPGIFT